MQPPCAEAPGVEVHTSREFSNWLAEHMGAKPTYVVGFQGHGQLTSSLTLAVNAVASGAAKAVLVYRAFNERSGRRFGQPNARVTPPGWNWYLPFGLDTPAKIYALQFQRYMHEFGATSADFGRVSVADRKHAANNPRAWFYEKPITLSEPGVPLARAIERDRQCEASDAPPELFAREDV